MDLGRNQTKERAESIVPMINVVFLLMIFFLMTATVAPPAPFEVAPPMSDVDQPGEAGRTLFVDASGVLAWSEHRGDAVYGALAGAGLGRSAEQPLLIRADRTVAGSVIGRVIARLARGGITHAHLIVARR
ncbi:MAG: biopolymer transporter ExbD [Pseudomonadota bacterium]